MSQFHFEHLTPDFMLDALWHYGFDVASGLLPLNSYENRVYQFKDQDRKNWVVKFYRPERWSLAQLQEEHQFVAELVAAEIPVAQAVQRDAEYVLPYQGSYLAIYPSLGGRQFEPDQDEHLLQTGALLGRLHQVAAGKGFQHRPEFSAAQMLGQSSDVLLNSGFIPKTLEREFSAVLQQLQQKAGQLYRPERQIRLHGDCHPGNLVWANEQVMLLDFDDCRMGPAVQDLWLLLHGDRAEQQMQLGLLLDEYEQFCDFAAKELTLIEPLRAMRQVSYMAWLAQRWDDPAFARHFPWFSSSEYWQQQLKVLDEQLKRCGEPPLSLMPQW
ncbi:serine/threonine protein kinase [Rheinheimera sp.]|uniref:serine/threonine protein kinase n=1 Tax=Rheinheimera sp. TaxID=1869214 RepID=UPI00307D3C7F